MRVVVDTNVVVSSALSSLGYPARIFQLWNDEDAYILLVTEPILEEYRRALRYEHVRARHRLTEQELDELVDDLAESAVLVDPQGERPVIHEDPKDTMFVECAVAGQADYIVSGDRHLLDLKEYQGIQVMSPAVFAGLLEGPKGSGES